MRDLSGQRHNDPPVGTDRPAVVLDLPLSLTGPEWKLMLAMIEHGVRYTEQSGFRNTTHAAKRAHRRLKSQLPTEYGGYSL